MKKIGIFHIQDNYNKEISYKERRQAIMLNKYNINIEMMEMNMMGMCMSSRQLK